MVLSLEGSLMKKGGEECPSSTPSASLTTSRVVINVLDPSGSGTGGGGGSLKVGRRNWKERWFRIVVRNAAVAMGVDGVGSPEPLSVR